MKKQKNRWKLDFEIGMGVAVVMLIASVGFAAAATVKTRPRYRGALPKAAPRKVVVPPKKAVAPSTTKVAPKDLPKAPTTVRKESPPSSGIPVITAPAPTPQAGASSDY